MKKLTLLVISWFMCNLCLAQEGYIRYEVKSEIYDSKAKESMQKVNDPAVQEQLRAIEEQMKDPEMQKIMEQNPQLKAQMEMMAGLSKGENVMDKIMPKSIVISYKNGNSLMKMDGAISTEILYVKATNLSYQLNRNERTYRIIEPVNDNQTKPKQKAVKTNETKKILGYTCSKYIVTNASEKQIIWATSELKDFDFKKIGSFDQHGGGLPEGVDGMPLRFEISSKEMNITFEAVEYKQEVLKNTDFMVPADFVKQ